MHAQNSLLVQRAVARLVPDVIRRWALREVKKSRGKYTLPWFLVISQLAGWNSRTTAGENREIDPYQTIHWRISNSWTDLELIPELSYQAMEMIYKIQIEGSSGHRQNKSLGRVSTLHRAWPYALLSGAERAYLWGVLIAMLMVWNLAQWKRCRIPKEV